VGRRPPIRARRGSLKTTARRAVSRYRGPFSGRTRASRISRSRGLRCDIESTTQRVGGSGLLFKMIVREADACDRPSWWRNRRFLGVGIRGAWRGWQFQHGSKPFLGNSHFWRSGNAMVQRGRLGWAGYVRIPRQVRLAAPGVIAPPAGELIREPSRLGAAPEQRKHIGHVRPYGVSRRLTVRRAGSSPWRVEPQPKTKRSAPRKKKWVLFAAEPVWRRKMKGDPQHQSCDGPPDSGKTDHPSKRAWVRLHWKSSLTRMMGANYPQKWKGPNVGKTPGGVLPQKTIRQALSQGRKKASQSAQTGRARPHGGT